VVRDAEYRRFAAAVLGSLAVAAAYVATGWLGEPEHVVVAGETVSALWPPTGIALAGLLFLGLRVWPGIALGALSFQVSLWPWHHPAADVGVVVGEALAPVCAYLMLRRVGFRLELDRLRDGVALVFLGALAGMLISATIGTLSLALFGPLPMSGFWPIWSAWWAGDAMGVLVVTPLLLVLRRARPPRGIPLSRWAEAAALAAGTVVVTFLVTRSPLSLLFLVFPLLIWAALRFQLAGAAPSALFVAVLAVSAATRRLGPFAHHGIFAVMVTLQALNGSAALTTLLLSAMITERNNTHHRIQHACRQLAEVVARLAPGETRRLWPPEE
jgi:integral membrane sensor domain MASE1